MKREIDALLRAYADRKRKQADTIEQLARALADVAEADERFHKKLADAFRPQYAEPSTVTSKPLSDLFRTLDELSENEYDAMRRAP